MESRSRSSARGTLQLLAGLLAAYLIAPLLALLWQISPGAVSGLGSPALISALLVSAGAATVSATVIALCGIPLGYLLARGRSRWLGPLGLLVQLPLALPPLASGILLLFLVGPYTPLGTLLRGALTDSFAGIVLAQTFVAAPFLIVAARSAFAGIDESLEGVAATLGHGFRARFVRVSLPIAWPGIRAGLLLAWVRAFGEFGATVTLAYHPYSLPVYTFVQFGSTGLPATLPPVLVALLAALCFLSLSLWRPRRRRAESSTKTPEAVRPGSPPRPLSAPSGERIRFDVHKSIGTFHLAARYEGRGRHLVLLGPSGSGKSVTLRLLAGLEPLDAGAIELGGDRLSRLPPEYRPIGYVPQDYGLFPHMTVAKQVRFGVGADPGAADFWLWRFGLQGLQDRLPHELSGGQRQRVALVRALARGPRLLLLDEPFSALDAPVREGLRRELRALQREVGLTTVLVTHDPAEAAMLADDVLILSAGRVVQAGPVSEVWGRPSTPEVARLIGIANVQVGRVADRGSIESGGVRLPAPTRTLPTGERVIWCVRPEDVDVSSEGGVPAVVTDTVDLGGLREITVALSPTLQLTVRTPRAGLEHGSHCHLKFSPDSVTCWPDGREGAGD